MFRQSLPAPIPLCFSALRRHSVAARAPCRGPSRKPPEQPLTWLWPHLLEQSPGIELPATKPSPQEVTEAEPTSSALTVRAPHRRPRTSGRAPTQLIVPRALPYPHAARRQLQLQPLPLLRPLTDAPPHSMCAAVKPLLW
jgi:hypothetical protein